MPFDFTYFGRTYDHLFVDRYGVASFWLGKPSTRGRRATSSAACG